MPVRFTVRDDGIEPPEVGVPGFLALELIIRNDTSRPIVARLEGTEPLTVEPGGDDAGADRGPPARALSDRLRRCRPGAARHRRRARALTVRDVRQVERMPVG